MGAPTWLEVAPGRILDVTQGDITRVAAEAIVNAANSALAGGGGVDGAIHRAGGPAIMRDLETRYGHARWIDTGEAVVSAAGHLPARWVIHAVGPMYLDGASGEAGRLAAAYANAMARAEEVGARSVAFPAISCGIFGYPLEAAAGIALRTVAARLRETRHVARATFVLYSFDVAEVFTTALGSVRDELRPAAAS